MANITPLTRCPTCKTPTSWSDDNPFRPFCSKRCQLIDFGEWMKESYTIPEEKDSDTTNSNADL